MTVVAPVDSPVATPASAAPAPPPDLEPRAYARALRRILLVALGVGIALRFVRLIIPCAIWGDEAMLSLNFLNRDYAGLMRFLDNGQVAPVLFLWVERFVVTTLGMSDWQVRLYPFLTSVGALFLVWDFARRTVSPTAATFALATLAVAVWPVSMAATLKPYSGDLFWSALLLALAARWHQRPERLWPLAALAATVPVVLASSYPAVFVAGAVSLYLLPVAWSGRGKARLLFLAYNAAMLGTFLATYLAVGQAQVDPAVGTTGAFMRWYWRNGFPPESALQFPLWFLQANTGRMFAYPVGDGNGGSSLTTLMFLLGVGVCWRNGSRPLVVLCLTPFALNLLAAFLGKYPYAGCCRLSQHLAPAICLLSAVGSASVFERLAPRRERRLALVRWCVALVILFGTGELIHRCVALDHDPLARFAAHLYDDLSCELGPDDRVVVTDLKMCDVSTQWYLRRFGDRLVTAAGDDRLAAADRIWVVSMTAYHPPHAEHEAYLRAVPGRIAHETVWYSVRPHPTAGNFVWWHIAVTCLVRPNDPRPSPRLNAVP